MIRHLAAIASTVGLAVLQAGSPPTQQATSGRSLVEHETGMAVRQPGPHEGGGITTAFPFFAKAAPDFKMAFRKRILHKGSAIGYHRQTFDEVYYIISGTGDYTLNGMTQSVGPGTAMLTRRGDSHGLRPTGDGDLVIIIAYSTQGS